MAEGWRRIFKRSEFTKDEKDPEKEEQIANLLKWREEITSHTDKVPADATILDGIDEQLRALGATPPEGPSLDQAA